MSRIFAQLLSLGFLLLGVHAALAQAPLVPSDVPTTSIENQCSDFTYSSDCPLNSSGQEQVCVQTTPGATTGKCVTAYQNGLPPGSYCTSTSDQCGGSYVCTNGTCQPAPATGGTTGSQTGGNTGGVTGSQTSGTTNTGSNVTLLNPLGSNITLPGLLTEILQFVIQIGTIVIILMIVFVGYKFVMAQGKEEKLREARQMLLWTIVGALILLGAQAIATAIQATAAAL